MPGASVDRVAEPGHRHTFLDSPLGSLLALADGQRVTGLYFEHHRYPPDAATTGPAVEAANDPVFARLGGDLADYFAGRRCTFDIEVGTAGDPFAEQVWALLRAIPYGETTTYGRLAEALGNPALAQRVGQAVGHNPISIVIPCHRVIGADGSLTGFAGGLARKRWLLDLEEPAERRAERLF